MIDQPSFLGPAAAAAAGVKKKTRKGGKGSSKVLNRAQTRIHIRSWVTKEKVKAPGDGLT
jgi:hypothetical protein